MFISNKWSKSFRFDIPKYWNLFYKIDILLKMGNLNHWSIEKIVTINNQSIGYCMTLNERMIIFWKVFKSYTQIIVWFNKIRKFNIIRKKNWSKKLQKIICFPAYFGMQKTHKILRSRFVFCRQKYVGNLVNVRM